MTKISKAGRAMHEIIATLAKLDLPDRPIALRAACEYFGIECVFEEEKIADKD